MQKNEDGDEEEYYRSRTGTFPVRWTSPEAMQTMRFSEASDVWSFAVTLIEIFTDGGKPYAGMPNAAVISQVQGGYRAEQPKLCTDAIYAMMLKCWSANPADRPTFVQLVIMLEGVDIAASEPGTEKTGGDKKSKKSKKKTKNDQQRQAVAVNDTYMTDEPAAAASGDDADVDNEYLSVAAGIAGANNNGDAADVSDMSDFEC